MKIIFEIYFNKKSGFVEKDFLNVVSKNINDLGKEMKINSLEYRKVDEGYLFAIEFHPALPMFPYQPILGCFAGLEMEYPHVDNISIPMENMKLIQ